MLSQEQTQNAIDDSEEGKKEGSSQLEKTEN
jgi:hypothetical protein